MKIKNIVQKMYKAILEKDTETEKKLWFKALRKSLKQKKTHTIK
jgi:flagellar biosynthesis/type III secretory pathway protein FliH